MSYQSHLPSSVTEVGSNKISPGGELTGQGMLAALVGWDILCLAESGGQGVSLDFEWGESGGTRGEITLLVGEQVLRLPVCSSPKKSGSS